MSAARTAFLSLICVLAFTTAHAQVAPNCDVTCSPNPTDPSYGGLLASRVMKQNARGTHNSVVGMVGGPLKVPMLPGSQSYNKAIPILSLPGRGIDLNLTLWYNSRIYDVDTSNSTVTFNADRDFPSYGFRLDFGYIEYDAASPQMILTESDGTKHALPLAANVSGGSIYDSNDGSFIEFSTVNQILTYRDGTIIQYQPFPNQPVQGQTTLYRPITVMDTNRNYVSISYVAGTGNDQHIDTIKDTLGRIIKFIYIKSPDNKDLLSQIQQLGGSPATPGFDSTGARVWATFTWAQTTLTYNFATSLHVVSTPANGSAINILTSCKYPNGTGYQFSYSPWGIMNRIDQVSSTGLIRSYETYTFPDTSQPLSDVPTYTAMKVSPDGSSLSTWSYASTKNGVGQVTSEAITDPLGTVTTVNLSSDGSVSSTQVKDSSGKIFQTVSFTWANSLISSIVTTDDAGNQSTVSYGYDAHGNPTDKKEFDFTGTNPARETITSYKQAPYTTNHIFTLPESIQVKDGSGNLKSRMDYAYDETSRNALNPFPVQNDGNTTAPRGNLTSVTRYPTVVDLTKKITRTFTYDASGNMVVAQLDCCNQKTFTFDPTAQYAYLTSVVRGPAGGQQFTTNLAFNLDNGLLQSSTDENNQQTSLQYDNMYRVYKVTPPTPAGVQTINYADDILTPQIQTTTTANLSQLTQTFDGLGHITKQQFVNTSTGNAVSTTQFQYDAIWRRNSDSNPYASGEAVVWSNVGYDALNRVTSITAPTGGGSSMTFSGNTVLVTDPAGKQRKNFYDALGRLVRVDEPGWGDALAAVDSVSISGAERSKLVSTRYCAQYTFSNPPRCVDWEFDTSTDYDAGNVTAIINGVAYAYPYGQNDTSSTVATNLAGKINADPARVVNASPSGSTINLYAVNPGASGNSISVSTSSVTSNSAEFGSGTTSFPASTFTPNLSGGENAVTQDNAVLSATRHITTTYAYDVFAHLVLVSQGAMTNVNGGNLSGQPRSYVYDDLGRSTSATTPESGTVTNYYTDASGAACSGDPSLVCRTVDARGIIKTFTYNDPLNRITGVSYSDNTTPSVTYTYDFGGQAAFALGRLTKISEDVSTATTPNAQTFTYDNLGRVATVTHTIAGANYPVTYGYNAASQTTSITYPSGRVVNPGYDGVGRLAQVADAANSNPYISVNSADYNGAGEIKKLVLGNGITGLLDYNDHLQVSTIRYYNPTAPTGTADVLNLSYDYTSTAQPNNNGQIQAIHYYTLPGTEDRTRSESFTYDAWKRLRQAQTLDTSAANTWNLNWGYDRLGNRFSQSGTGTATIGQPTFSINTATNQIIGYCYDLAGNLTDEATCPTGTHQYTYDGANRLTNISGSSVTYAYFGQLRIKKTTASGTTIYIYSEGKPIAEYSAGAAVANPSKEYIYAGSQLLASVAGSSTTYYHPDHLSNRAETDSAGNVSRRLGNFPYGESWYDSTPSEKWKFTTYERDLGTGETGLDYAQFRYYSSKQGRFMTADLLAGDSTIPQSMNRYSYVLGDPINLFDPAGLCGIVTVTTTEYDLNGKVKSKHTTVTDEGSCLGGGGGTVGGGGGLPGGPGGGGGGGNPKKDAVNRILQDGDCLNFILGLLQKAFNFANSQSATRPSQSTVQEQQKAISPTNFANTLDSASLVPASNPNPNYGATAGIGTITIHPGFYGSGADQPEMLIHETFHLAPFFFSDSELARALNAPFAPGSTPQKTEENASAAWNKELNKHCGKK